MKNNSLKDFIEVIRDRTSMYIGGRTIIHLKAFLDGWYFGNEESIKDAYLLGEFQDWIQIKYSVTSTQSWAKIILFHSMDEYAALNNFFDLWTNFMESYNE